MENVLISECVLLMKEAERTNELVKEPHARALSYINSRTIVMMMKWKETFDPLSRMCIVYAVSKMCNKM